MGAFKEVREAFAARLAESLTSLGITAVGKRPMGEWLQCVCPCCDDKGGSASISINTGHLKCHQCGENLELFALVMRTQGIGEKWQACQWLADQVGVTITTASTATKRRRRDKAMTDELLAECVNTLCFADTASAARKFLASRGLGDPEWLEKLDVGYLEGKIIFAHRDEAGQVKRRFRTYAHGARVPWGWSGPRPSRGEPTNTFWPCYPPPKDALVILTEGEWDCWTGYERLQLHRQKGYLYTYTGGAKAIPAPLIPRWMRDRKVLIVPDNDVFQGPRWDDHVAPTDNRRLEMQKRRDGLYMTCETLRQLGNKVRVAKIPIDPRDKWGADFRDWVDGGGRDISILESWSYEELIEAAKPKPRPVEFHEVRQNVGHPVIFRCRLTEISGRKVTVPAVTHIDCQMGEHISCNSCLVPTRFPTQLIEWDKIPHELLWCQLTRDPALETLKRVLGRPRGCPHANLNDEAFVEGSIWSSGAPEDSEEIIDDSIEMLSAAPPSVSSVMEVTGTPYHISKQQVGVLVQKLKVLDSTDRDYKDAATKAREIISAHPKFIDKEVANLADDLSYNVTRIYGRRGLHIAMLLTACSPRWIKVNNKRMRGWLDISIIGTTGSGKTDAWTQFIGATGLGTLHTSMTNTSRAGFVMGSAPGRHQEHRVKPGLYPRANGQLLVIDEAHLMGETNEGRVIAMLQSARESGWIEGVKAYGAKRMPAQVRLVTIANPVTKGGARLWRYGCQNLPAIYGSAEAIRRLDFCLWIEGYHESMEPVEPKLTQDFLRATILRAWSQHEQDVRITQEAEDLARQYVDDWGRLYHPDGDVPLFSGADMVGSVLRIAASVSNLLWHHADDDVRCAKVTPDHVRWAASWMEWTWEQNEYTKLTRQEARSRVLETPFEFEVELLVRAGLSAPDEAIRIIEKLTGEFSPADIAMTLSIDPREIGPWMGPLLRMGAIDIRDGRSGPSPRPRLYRLTKGAQDYLHALTRIARHSPTVYRERWAKLSEWNMRGMSGTPSLERADEIEARLDISGEVE